MAGAIILTSRGIPFFMAGEEFLRTKKNGDKPVENSYNAIDNVNGIDWSLLDEQESNITNESYKKLIKIRKSHKLLRLTTAKEIEKATNFIIIESRYDIIAYTLKNKKEELLIIYNPLNEYLFDLPKGKWKSIFGVKGSYESKILIPPISCIILKRVFR